MITKIKWNNYSSLGNIELDFTNPVDGSVYNTIVLAGENGSGKTTILDTLAAFLNKQTIIPFEYIEYVADGKTYQITPDPKETYASLGFHVRRDVQSGNTENVSNGQNNRENLITQDSKDLRYYGFAYSKARSGFRTEPVRSITTQQIDKEKYEPDNQEDYTRIKQLLIDIDNQDSSAWMKQCESKGISDQKFDSFKKQSKGYRFEKSFNDFFKTLRYKGVDNDDPNEKRILFEKHGKRISVDHLSTGEKQIVFRGAHLLRNVNNISNGIVLIDEPELSMHPLWQKRVLQYYRGLFKSNGTQSVQMIIATHSEYVIQAALEDRKDVLVIVLSDKNGTIIANRITAPNVLPSVTAAETNYMAFGVPTNDYHIELYGWLQTKSGKHTIGDCDAYIMQQAQYDSTIHEKIDNSYPGHYYKTLPTYIRNAIDHPDSGRIFSEDELKTSIELLIELCR